ncbi:hypothetical protein Franean1_0411 [Parafrankia sp. EAN1pec]|nr:hypothetical protein Franean1_0411 [Frankia sp. EAN1pec]
MDARPQRQGAPGLAQPGPDRAEPRRHLHLRSRPRGPRRRQLARHHRPRRGAGTHPVAGGTTRRVDRPGVLVRDFRVVSRTDVDSLELPPGRLRAARGPARCPSHSRTSERARLRELEKENRELRMEREFLSKATAFFAQRHQ